MSRSKGNKEITSTMQKAISEAVERDPKKLLIAISEGLLRDLQPLEWFAGYYYFSAVYTICDELKYYKVSSELSKS